MPQIDKRDVLEAVVAQIKLELETARAAQRQTQAGVTHEESRPENEKDTRALEASYLARGQAQRVLELSEALTQVSALPVARVGDGTAARIGAIVQLQAEDDDSELWYLLAPAGGGLRVSLSECTLTVLTPHSPVGQALIGRRVGDDIDIRTPQGTREFSISAVL